MYEGNMFVKFGSRRLFVSRKWILSLLFFGGALFLSSCSHILPEVIPAEDMAYLTPIPATTISAFRFGDPIENKLQAVIAARAELMAPPHFKPIGKIDVRYVEESKLSEVYLRLGKSASYSEPNWTESTKVWLVIFESDIQVTPPGEKTPNPPFHGCSYVIIQAVNAIGGEVGGVDCAQFREP